MFCLHILFLSHETELTVSAPAQPWTFSSVAVEDNVKLGYTREQRRETKRVSELVPSIPI